MTENIVYDRVQINVANELIYVSACQANIDFLTCHNNKL